MISAAPTCGMLDEFEVAAPRAIQRRSARLPRTRLASQHSWSGCPAPVEESLRKLTAAMLIEWVDLGSSAWAGRHRRWAQLVMLRSFLQHAHRSGRVGQDLSGVVPRGGVATHHRFRTRCRRAMIEAPFDTRSAFTERAA